MRYVSGNLAVQIERELPRRRPNAQVHQKVVSVRYSLPIKEKLAYLFLVVLVICISGILLSRYAEIAEMNYKIQEMKTEISELQKENDLLLLKVAELKSPDRILDLAFEMGMTQKEGNVRILSIPNLE